MKKILKIAKNPNEFYNSINYNDQRMFQNILYPEYLKFSLKNKLRRTSKENMIFDLTNSFKIYYNSKKEKTQMQIVHESHLVAGNGIEPVTFGL